MKNTAERDRFQKEHASVYSCASPRKPPILSPLTCLNYAYLPNLTKWHENPVKRSLLQRNHTPTSGHSWKPCKSNLSHDILATPDEVCLYVRAEKQDGEGCVTEKICINMFTSSSFLQVPWAVQGWISLYVFPAWLWFRVNPPIYRF